VSRASQEDKDLRYMRVMEASASKTLDRRQHYASKLVKYDERVRKHQAKEKEARLDRSHSAHSLRVKREMVKSFRDKADQEVEEVAYQAYIDDQKVKRMSTPSQVRPTA